jgi:hypothetical protein
LGLLLYFERWSLDGIAPPWDGESLYEILKAKGPSAELPKRPKRHENEVGWAPGALDGVMGRHFGRAADHETQHRVKAILAALARLLKRSSQSNLSALYTEVQGEALLSIADALQDDINSSLLKGEKDRKRIARIGRYFATKAAERESTKFGILLLGLCGQDADRPVLETLALNDEFTLYAALALCELSSNPETILWEIAQRVHGWGRVQVVERLDGTENPAIQAWMLRDGFRNHIMDEYLAGICARTGKLHEALSATNIDHSLLAGAAGIIKAFLFGGPADSFDDYPEGPIAIRSYLRHTMQTSDLSLEHLLCIGHLRTFLSEASRWEKRSSQGWTPTMRDEMQSACSQLMERSDWRAKIDSALRSQDGQVFHQGDAAARVLGVDTREIHFAKVRSEPIASSSWYRLLQQTNETQIEEVLDFAEQALPLDEIATGPADSPGFGEKYAAHRTLDWILQDLKRFPCRGWTFIEAGLQSPVVRNRNLALSALLEWPRPAWPEQAEKLLSAMKVTEPNQELRNLLESICVL